LRGFKPLVASIIEEKVESLLLDFEVDVVSGIDPLDLSDATSIGIKIHPIIT
jgi:hypothetical protein